MPSARDIRAGAAYVELYANDNKLTRGLNRASKRLKAFGAGVKKIGMSMAKLSAVMAAPLVAGGKVFADFEQQLAKVSTMLDNPAKHMDTYKKAIRDMAVEFGESTEALANGLYDILSASIPAEKALDVLTVAVKAAKGGMTDTATAADALTTVLNSYGLSADRAQDVSDLLFTVVKRGKLTFADLAPTIGLVASVASSAGVSLDEMGAAIATMTRSGVRSERAVTALANIIKSFLTPTEESVEAARALGFEMSVATLQTEGLAGVFERIKKLPPDTVAKLFPNIRALRGVIPALKNIEGFEKDLQLMAKRAGSADEAFEKMAGTLAHLFGQVKESAKVVLSVTGEALAKSLGKAAATIKKYAKGIVDLIQKNQQVVVTIAKIVAIVGAAGVALIILGTVISGIGAAFGAVVSVITAFGIAIGVVGSVLAAVLSPLGLVITAVAGLGAYLVYASGLGGKALDWLGGKFGGLKDTVGKAIGGISDALAAGDIGLAARILWLTLKLEWQKGVKAVMPIVWNFKRDVLSVHEMMVNGVAKLWTQVSTVLKSIWIDLVAAFKKNAPADWVAKQILAIQGAVGVLTPEQVKSAQAGVDESAKIRAGIVDAERTERHRANSELFKATMEGLEQTHQVRMAQIGTEHKAKLQAIEQELANAQQAWGDALAEAAKAGEGGKVEGAGPGKAQSLEEYLKQVGNVLSTISEQTISVFGTFNPAAAFGLGANTAADRTARATEETAKNTRRMVGEMVQGQMRFA